MDSTPQVPHNDRTDKGPWSPAPRSLADVMSWGEQLLPLAYAALEACGMGAVLIGLARVHFLGLAQPFAPLWAPFLLMITSSWCAMILPDQALKNDSKKAARPHTGNLALVIQGIGVLCVVWGTFYAGAHALWNPTWLMALLSDFVLFNPTAFAIIVIITMSYTLCYRGIRITRYVLEPSETLRSIIIGSIIFVSVCLIPPAGTNDQAYLLLLVLLFFSLALLTRALSYAIFIRQDHLTGLQGSKFMQDRLILSTVSMVCLILAVVGLILGLTINPALLAAVQQFLSPLGRVYDGATYAIAWIMAFLISWIPLDPRFKFTPPKIHQFTQPQNPHPKSGEQFPPAVQTIAGLIFIVLLIAILATVIILIVALLRKRKVARRSLDLHESLWSWELFWLQITGLLKHLWQRLSRHNEQPAPIAAPQVEEDETSILRDVRAIYRAFLQWAANQGYRRQHAETPGEFKQRLVQPLPAFEPEVQVVTEIYTEARYSHVPPGDAEVARMQQSWLALQKKSTSGEQ